MSKSLEWVWAVVILDSHSFLHCCSTYWRAIRNSATKWQTTTKETSWNLKVIDFSELHHHQQQKTKNKNERNKKQNKKQKTKNKKQKTKNKKQKTKQKTKNKKHQAHQEHNKQTKGQSVQLPETFRFAACHQWSIRVRIRIRVSSVSDRSNPNPTTVVMPGLL